MPKSDDIEIKLGMDDGDADEAEPDYTDDAINDAGERVCVALGIDKSKAAGLVRTLRPLIALMKD